MNRKTTTLSLLKTLFLMLTLSFSSVAMAQTVIFEENFDFLDSYKGGNDGVFNDAAGNVNTTDSLTKIGWTRENIYAANKCVKGGTSSKAGKLTTPALTNANNGDAILTFKLGLWTGDKADFRISLIDGGNFKNGLSSITVLDNHDDPDYSLEAGKFNDIEVVLYDITPDTKICFEGYASSRARFFLDEIKVVTKASESTLYAEHLDIFDFNITETSLTENIAVSGKNMTPGDLTVVLSNIEGEAFSTTVTTITITEATFETSIPVTFTPALADVEYTGTITFSGCGLTEDVVINLKGEAFDPTYFVVANIAELKAKGTDDKTSVFTLTGDLTVTHVNGNNIFVQDETGATILYNKSGLELPEYTPGDVIKGGAVGTIALYYGLFELYLTEVPAESVENVAVVPTVVDAKDIVDNYSTYESKLVTIKNVSFDEGKFAASGANRSISFTHEETPLDCYDNFKVLTDVTPSSLHNNQINITGFVSRYTTASSDAIQIHPRTADDLAAYSTTSIKEVEAKAAIYTADNNVVITVESAQSAVIYNAIGQVVKSATLKAGENIISLPYKGVYIVKVEGSTVKVKL